MRGETMKDKSKKSTYSTTFGVDPFSEANNIANILAVFDNLSDSLHYNIVAKLWCEMAVAV